MKKLVLFALVLLCLNGCVSPPSRTSGGGFGTSPATGEKADIPLNQGGAVSAETTRNFYVVFDGSGSMQDGCGDGDKQFRRKIDGAKWALKEFMKKVPADANLGLFVFDDRGGAREVVPLDNNRQRFLQEIEKVEAGGGTPLAEAIRFGTDQLIKQYKKQLGYGEYRLVVVTDGQADRIPEAVQYASRYRFSVPIYAIGFCIGDNHPLKQLAFSYRSANNSVDLARGLEETLGEMSDFDSSFAPSSTASPVVVTGGK